MKEPYFTNGIKFSNFDNIRLGGYTGVVLPSNKKTTTIFLENGNNYRILNSFLSAPGARFIIKKSKEILE